MPGSAHGAAAASGSTGVCLGAAAAGRGPPRGAPRSAAFGKGGIALLSENLLALLAVQDTGSVTGAAARRHLTQPALSRQLQRLTESVGLPLLERRGRGVALTAAGLAVAALARRQVGDWGEALAAVRGELPGPLRLGCGTTVALTLLPAALSRLRAQLPDLSLEVHAGDSAATAARCLSGELDAGLVTTAAAESRLVALPIASDPVLAVGPAEGPAGLSLQDLAGGPLCLYVRGTGFRAFVDELFAAAGLFPRPVAEMDALEVLRELVVAGLGRSLLPHSVVAAAARQGRLRVLTVEGLPAASRTIALLRRVDRPPHPGWEALYLALRDAARAHLLAEGAALT